MEDTMINSLTKQGVVNLYNNTSSSVTKQTCLDRANKEKFCIRCGTDFVLYEWLEEEDDCSYLMCAWDCPQCGDIDKENARAVNG